MATWLVGQAADWLRLAWADRLLGDAWPSEQDHLGLFAGSASATFRPPRR